VGLGMRESGCDWELRCLKKRENQSGPDSSQKRDFSKKQRFALSQKSIAADFGLLNQLTGQRKLGIYTYAHATHITHTYIRIKLGTRTHTHTVSYVRVCERQVHTHTQPWRSYTHTHLSPLRTHTHTHKLGTHSHTHVHTWHRSTNTHLTQLAPKKGCKFQQN
jgi:hypothetical protein